MASKVVYFEQSCRFIARMMIASARKFRASASERVCVFPPEMNSA